MKTLICCASSQTDWVRSCFPNLAPFLLPIVNKPLLEYYIDFAVRNNAKDILIADDDYSETVANFLGDGSRWDANIRYLGVREGTTPQKLLQQNAFFFEAEDVYIFYGMFFLHYDINSEFSGLLPHLTKTNTPGIYIKSATDDAYPPQNTHYAEITELRDVEEYFALNMRILTQENQFYVLPGYKIENGIFTGMNDVIPPDVHIHEPVMLGDNIHLVKANDIGPNAIIGNDVIVDGKTQVTDSIILDNTYLGNELEFVHKIVYRNYIIDPALGVPIDIRDTRLTTTMKARTSDGVGRFFFARVIAIVLFLLGIIPFILAVLFGVRAERTNYYIVSTNAKNKIKLKDYPVNRPQWYYTLFFKLSLDKVPMYPYVLLGKLSLVGHVRYDKSTPLSFILENYQNYTPGVFSISEMHQTRDPAGLLIDDLYYSHNRSVKVDATTLLRCLVGRLMKFQQDNESNDLTNY